jgi:hypothetical protein
MHAEAYGTRLLTAWILDQLCRHERDVGRNPSREKTESPLNRYIHVPKHTGDDPTASPKGELSTVSVSVSNT